MSLAKAKLIELKQDFKGPKDGGQQVEVQFNPESLKVTFANDLVPKSGDQAAGNNGLQFVGSGTTKLALLLWFDVTALETNPVDDVRRLTQKVIFFMTPQAFDQNPEQKGPEQKVPPAVRFEWGSFKFDGVIDALEESLEFFSPEGKPLRARINLTLSQQKILEATFDDQQPVRPGQQRLTAAKQGESLQSMAGRAGNKDWQSVAAANGIEDPLRLAAGQLIDLSARAGATFGVSVPSRIAAPRLDISFGAAPRLAQR